MDIRSYIRKSGGRLLAAVACASMLYACDGLIYDGEGDCTVFTSRAKASANFML